MSPEWHDAPDTLPPTPYRPTAENPSAPRHAQRELCPSQTLPPPSAPRIRAHASRAESARHVPVSRTPDEAFHPQTPLSAHAVNVLLPAQISLISKLPPLPVQNA